MRVQGLGLRVQGFGFKVRRQISTRCEGVGEGGGGVKVSGFVGAIVTLTVSIPDVTVIAS